MMTQKQKREKIMINTFALYLREGKGNKKKQVMQSYHTLMPEFSFQLKIKRMLNSSEKSQTCLDPRVQITCIQEICDVGQTTHFPLFSSMSRSFLRQRAPLTPVLPSLRAGAQVWLELPFPNRGVKARACSLHSDV